MDPQQRLQLQLQLQQQQQMQQQMQQIQQRQGSTPMTAEQLRALQNSLSPQQYAWLLKNLQQQQAQAQQVAAQQALQQRQQQQAQQHQQQAQVQQQQQLLQLQQRISQLPPEMQVQVQQQLRLQQQAQAMQRQMLIQQQQVQQGQQLRASPQQILQIQQQMQRQQQMQLQRQQQMQTQQALLQRQKQQHPLLMQQQQHQAQLQQQHYQSRAPGSGPPSQGNSRTLHTPPYPPPLKSAIAHVKRQRTYPKLPLPPLLPPINTYAERLRKGDSGLLEPASILGVLTGKRGRGRGAVRQSFRESSSSLSEDEETSSEASDDDDSGESKEFKQEIPRSETLVDEIPPNSDSSPLPTKERRAIRQTKHDYSRLYMARLPQLAATNEVLVPIRLDFETTDYKLRDTFTWNLHEQLMTPDMFAQFLCLDLNLPQHLQSSISTSIQTQLSEYRTFLISSDVPPAVDCRVPIILDIHVGKIYLRDRFEWDLASPLAPEAFADILVSELGLSSEFKTMIAHSIREQVYKLRADGDCLYNPFALESRIRGEEEAQGWCPTVELMTLEEMERFDNGRERKGRAQRRELKLANRRKSGWTEAAANGQSPTTRVASGSLREEDLSSTDNAKWICQHCRCPRSETSGLMHGPIGPDSLCETCGMYFDIHSDLPSHRQDLYRYLPRA